MMQVFYFSVCLFFSPQKFVWKFYIEPKCSNLWW